jgi:cytoskeleton protein RodZ
MGTVASELKAEREKRNIPLAYIATETRISLRHLESLEEGRYGDMPGGIYNRAFLKAYCEILDLNFPEIMQRYENEASLVSEKSSRIRAHVPQRSRSFSLSPVFIWGLIFVIAATGVYFSKKWITAIFSPYFSHTPPSTYVRSEKGNVPPPTAPKPSETAAPAAEPSAPATPSQSAIVAPQQTLSATSSSPSSKSTSGTTTSDVSPAMSTAPQTLQLEVTATEKCWISIERDGISAFRKNMQPGEIQFFDAAERFLVIAGNAGGVHLKINGKPVKALGKPGSVVRIMIDQKNLQDFMDRAPG